MLAGPAILAAACVVLGVFSYQVLAGFGYHFPIPDLLLVSVLLLLMGALTYVILWFTASHKERTGETWGCGARSLPSSTEYTGHGFSEPIVTIFSSVYQTKKTVTKKYYDEHDCIFAEGTAEIRLLKFFEEYLYLPIARGATRAAGVIARMQNGCLDTYLLYVFVAVVAVILFLGVAA
jgi:nicotinamide riboside transporter PnuC